MSETFKTYGKIHQIGKEEVKALLLNPDEEIVIQEKIDGGNFRFYFTEAGELIFGSRTQNLDGTKEGVIAKSFQRVIDHVRKQVETSKLDKTKLSHLIFYGEACFKHTITYDYDKMPPFIGFDVFNTQIDRYMHSTIAWGLFEELNLEYVTIVKTCKASEITVIDDTIVPIQKYALASAEDKQAEGVVFKNYNAQLFAKYVRDKFKEKNAHAFGGSPKLNKVDDTDNAEFIFKYCTNPRIEKIVMKKVNEGKPLDMTIMGEVIKQTYTDICEEEWREILDSNWKLDFKNIRRGIAPRCRSVLSQMITNNALTTEKTQ